MSAAHTLLARQLPHRVDGESPRPVSRTLPKRPTWLDIEPAEVIDRAFENAMRTPAVVASAIFDACHLEQKELSYSDLRSLHAMRGGIEVAAILTLLAGGNLGRDPKPYQDLVHDLRERLVAWIERCDEFRDLCAVAARELAAEKAESEEDAAEDRAANRREVAHG